MSFTVEDFQQLAVLQELAQSQFELPPASDYQPEDSLKELVRYLTTPAECGLFLSKIDLYRLARELRLPAAAGDRFTLLKDLLELAVQYDVLKPLLESLIRLADEAQKDLAQLQLELNYFSWESWRRRLTNTVERLAAA